MPLPAKTDKRGIVRLVAKLIDEMDGGVMPLTGAYEPSTFEFSRNQVDLYECSGGTEGTDNQGAPVIILTSLGAKTGKIRKTALQRVEHDGAYAVVASLGGAPKNPVWY